MASLDLRLASNAPGAFFVDSTCIDCDTCRWMAPNTFNRSGEQSRVYQQPQNEKETRAALQALIACPTASIGTHPKIDLDQAQKDFPLLIAEDVFHCGYHAESSFGAASYFIQRPKSRGGNVLIDSPRFNNPLVRRLEELGGVDLLFLTHIDDVADHERFAKHFSSRRAMHALEAPADFEIRIQGNTPHQLDSEILLIPTPGHTRGSTCLLYQQRFLFSGDHVAWSEARQHVYAFRSACWYDWNIQIDSMKKLAEHRFEWILPGHGWRCHFPASEMHDQMEFCVQWMRKPSI